MPDIEIRKAGPEDAFGIQEVYHKTWLSTYPNEEHGITVEDIEDSFKEAYTEETLAKRRERLANPRTDELMLVALHDGKVIGVCRAVAKEEFNQLQTIYILKEYQGKGVGTRLWEEAKRIFDPKKRTIVHVATYNPSAIAFYKKLGFKETGKIFTEERFRMKSGAMMPETELVLESN